MFPMNMAVDLVSADLMKTQIAKLVGRFQQHVGAIDIGLNEGIRVHDAAIDVRLGGKVDDGVDIKGT